MAASRAGGSYRTAVDAGLSLRRLTLGATLPLGTQVERVVLDGREVTGRLRETNRGLEVLADVTGKRGGAHALVVETR